MYAKGYSLDIMGSERSGLALATSDIDLRLTAPPIRGSKLEKAPRYVVRKALGRALVRIDSQLRFNAAYMLVSMRWARYPLISLQHLKSRLDLQVVAANDTVVSQSYIKKYLEENPGLRELFTLIKVTFDARGLSDVFRGGLGSYSLFMMIVASMKIGPQGQTGNLAQQLLSFLSFWSKFDTYSMGISLDPVAETFAKSSRTIITKKQQEELDKVATSNPLPPIND
jgi:non-canonical poly(A) RNA polymerase PAPD5/7